MPMRRLASRQCSNAFSRPGPRHRYAAGEMVPKLSGSESRHSFRRSGRRVQGMLFLCRFPRAARQRKRRGRSQDHHAGDALRTAWAQIEDWYGQKLPGQATKARWPTAAYSFGFDVLSSKRIHSCWGNRRVGQVWFRKYHSSSDDQACRLGRSCAPRCRYWVIKKIRPQFASSFVRCLGLCRRLTLLSRFRLGYRDSIHNLLKAPICASHVAPGLDSDERSVRREASMCPSFGHFSEVGSLTHWQLASASIHWQSAD